MPSASVSPRQRPSPVKNQLRATLPANGPVNPAYRPTRPPPPATLPRRGPPACVGGPLRAFRCLPGPARKVPGRSPGRGADAVPSEWVRHAGRARPGHPRQNGERCHGAPRTREGTERPGDDRLEAGAEEAAGSGIERRRACWTASTGRRPSWTGASSRCRSPKAGTPSLRATARRAAPSAARLIPRSRARRIGALRTRCRGSPRSAARARRDGPAIEVTSGSTR